MFNDVTTQPAFSATLDVTALDVWQLYQRVGSLPAHRLEYAVVTAAGTHHHPNEDAWCIAFPAANVVRFAVIDEITEKHQVASGEVASRAVDAISSSRGNVVDSLIEAHAALRKWLQSDTPLGARAGACAAALQLDGAVCTWAAVGDCAVRVLSARDSFSRTQKRMRFRDLFAPSEAGAGLQSALGCVEEIQTQSGRAKLRAGDVALLSSDGLHLSLAEQTSALEALYRYQRGKPTLPAIAKTIFAAARDNQPTRDDLTIVAVRYSG